MNALIINCSPVKTGATAEISKIISKCLMTRFNVKIICIEDYEFDFCKGCRNCHDTAKCIIQNDDITNIISEFKWADSIISVSPSYWADIPGQFKAFIDRCTPWCNTHDPHATIGYGKKGYCVALRTGSTVRECNNIIESIEHFYGHMEIASSGSLGLCSVEYISDVTNRVNEIETFCNIIKSK